MHATRAVIYCAATSCICLGKATCQRKDHNHQHEAESCGQVILSDADSEPAPRRQRIATAGGKSMLGCCLEEMCSLVMVLWVLLSGSCINTMFVEMQEPWTHS